MIRDVLILQHNGILLFSHNFGECSSFGKDIDVFSGFLAAIQAFAFDLSGTKINYMQLEDKALVFHKNNLLTYVLVCDHKDPIEDLKLKAIRIAELFEKTYHDEITNFYGEISRFKPFAQKIMDIEITKKNCGNRPECTDCPNHMNTLPLEKMINVIIEQKKKN